MTWRELQPILAKVAHGLSYDAAESAYRDRRGYSEAVLHEMAHGALLGRRDKFMASSRAIGDRIKTYLPFTADRHEMRTLAAEALVLRAHQLPFSLRHLCDFGSANFRFYGTLSDPIPGGLVRFTEREVERYIASDKRTHWAAAKMIALIQFVRAEGTRDLARFA